jgi:MFS family permease
MNNSQTSGSLAVLRERYGERYRWLVLLSVMVGTMASIMSSTIVNVAIPDMSHYFTLGQERAQWVTSGFMVATTVSMLTTPWLLSRYGYRATYVGAMLLLLAGGIGGGLARDFGLVLVARVAEGLAAGVVQPIPAVIILYAFKPHEQGRASGIFGMGVVLAPAIGPSIGGLLVDWFGWRSIFFMVVPLCLASIALAYKYVPVTAPGGVEANRQGQALDWRGLLLGTVGTLCPAAGCRRVGRAFHRVATPAVAAGSKAVDGPAPVPIPAVRDGQRGGVHLRHGALRLHLSPARVHATWPGAVGIACGHADAAGRLCAGRHHCRRGPPG